MAFISSVYILNYCLIVFYKILSLYKSIPNSVNLQII